MKQLVLLLCFLAFCTAEYDEWAAGAQEQTYTLTSGMTFREKGGISGIELGPCAPSSARLPCSPNYEETVAELEEIVSMSNGKMTLHSAGTSVEGRDMWYIKAGSGEKKYFAWGRIHGNECVGTAGILKVLRRLANGSHFSNFVLRRMTAILLPIANPDGSEAGTRNSAPFEGWPNGRDLNRDWCMQGQDEQPSPCATQAAVNPINQTPIGGCPQSVCSCPPESTQFITKEVNALWELYIAERPDIVMDIHQFGSAFLDGTDLLVGAQAVLPRTAHISEPIIHLNLQVAQVLYDSFEANGQIGSRWNNSIPTPSPDRSSAGRIADGRRNINDTRRSAGGMGLELRRVCPVYEDNLEELTFRILLDQIVATATRRIFNINNDRAVDVPFGVRFTCETECPDELPEEHKIDYASWEREWLSREVPSDVY